MLDEHTYYTYTYTQGFVAAPVFLVGAGARTCERSQPEPELAKSFESKPKSEFAKGRSLNLN